MAKANAKPKPSPNQDHVFAGKDQSTEGKNLVWTPHPGPQTWLLTCPYEEIFYGGARGGGKSDGLLGDILAHVAENPKHARCIVFRETYPDLEELIARSKDLYYAVGAAWKESKKTWKFPGGATLKFRFIERIKDARRYQGHQYTYIAFDEVGNVESDEIINILRACLRSAHQVRTRLVLTGNPLGDGHAWLKKRYIDPAPPLTPIHEEMTIRGVTRITTRVFIPSKLEDNPSLTQNDDYEIKLKQATKGKPWLYDAWRFGDWNAVPKVEGALWTPTTIEKHRVIKAPDLAMVVVGVDPAVTGKTTSDMWGIVVQGQDANRHKYVIKDLSQIGSPRLCCKIIVRAYRYYQADRVVAETNQGGEMIEELLRTEDPSISYAGVHATRGKHVRAEPIAAEYENGKYHHVGQFPELEKEQCTWAPLSGKRSPNRMDALVWGGHYLLENSSDYRVR